MSLTLNNLTFSKITYFNLESETHLARDHEFKIHHLFFSLIYKANVQNPKDVEICVPTGLCILKRRYGTMDYTGH